MGSAGIRITNSDESYIETFLDVSSLGIKGDFDVYAKIRTDSTDVAHHVYIIVEYGNENPFHKVGLEADDVGSSFNNTGKANLSTGESNEFVNQWVWFKLEFRINGTQVEVTSYYEQNDTDDYTTLSMTKMSGPTTLNYTTNEDVVQSVYFVSYENQASSSTFRGDMDAMHIVDVTV